MKSSQRLIESPFQPGTGTAEERLQNLKAKSDEWVGAPRPYIDENITFKIMDAPCNIKLAEGADYYLDADFARKLPCHPSFAVSEETKASWSNAWKTNQYPVDEAFRARILAWLTFAEFKHYYFELMKKRQAEYYHLCKFASPKAALLAKGSVAEIAKFYKINIQQFPARFFSALPDRSLMTLPVTLDNEYTIDFQELLDYQQPTFSTIMLNEITGQYAEYKQIKALEHKQQKENRDQLIAAAQAAIDNAPADISADDLETLQNNLELARNKTISPASVSLNTFIDTEIVEVNVPELYNPCTGEIVKHFCINQTLLQEILQTVSDVILPIQFRQVEKYIASFLAFPNENTCMEQLEADKYPPEKIPNSILQGSIPGKNTLEVMTHPVIIDGYFMVDYAHLKQYWESNEGWLGLLWGGSKKGMNPFTGKPITSILYLEALKNKTDRFVARNEFYRYLPDEKLHHPNFLEEFAAANHYVFFAHQDPLSPPHKKPVGLLQNLLNRVQYKQ